jgi:hypothetical protein
MHGKGLFVYKKIIQFVENLLNGVLFLRIFVLINFLSNHLKQKIMKKILSTFIVAFIAFIAFNTQATGQTLGVQNSLTIPITVDYSSVTVPNVAAGSTGNNSGTLTPFSTTATVTLFTSGCSKVTVPINFVGSVPSTIPGIPSPYYQEIVANVYTGCASQAYITVTLYIYASTGNTVISVQ